METSDNNKRIFAPSGCLEKDILLDYLAGKTDARETRLVEMHLADCPLCSDAADGLFSAETRDKLEVLLAEARPSFLKEATPVYTINEPQAEPVKKRRLNFVYIGIAASLALLVVSYFAVRYLPMSRQQKETLSYEEPRTEAVQKTEGGELSLAPAEKSTPAATEQTPAQNFSNTGPKANDQQQQNYWTQEAASGETALEKNLENEDQKVVDYSGIVDGVFSVTTVEDAELAENKNDIASDKDIPGYVAEEEKQVSAGDLTVETVTRSGKKEAYKEANAPQAIGGVAQNKTTQAVDERPQREVNDGLSAYQEGDYAGAASRFQSALKSDPGQAQALYYKGMSHYYLHQYDEALKSFQPLLRERKGQYFEAAQWQTAVIYIETGETRLARKTLNDIIDGNGTYRNPAEEAIKNLGDQ